MAEAYAFARAFDQARYVGDDELAAVRRVEGAEDRLERRERVVGDLRLRVGDPAEERGLAGVRQPDQRGIREKLQTQLVVGLLAGHADLGEPRRLAGGRGEAAVAAAADAATREHRPHTGVRQVDDEIAVEAFEGAAEEGEHDAGLERFDRGAHGVAEEVAEAAVGGPRRRTSVAIQPNSDESRES